MSGDFTADTGSDTLERVELNGKECLERNNEEKIDSIDLRSQPKAGVQTSG